MSGNSNSNSAARTKRPASPVPDAASKRTRRSATSQQSSALAGTTEDAIYGELTDDEAPRSTAINGGRPTASQPTSSVATAAPSPVRPGAPGTTTAGTSSPTTAATTAAAAPAPGAAPGPVPTATATPAGAPEPVIPTTAAAAPAPASGTTTPPPDQLTSGPPDHPVAAATQDNVAGATQDNTNVAPLLPAVVPTSEEAGAAGAGLNDQGDLVIARISEEGVAAVGVRAALRADHAVSTDRLDPAQLAPLGDVQQLALLNRIHRLMGFSDPDRGIYSMRTLPRQCVWGAASAFGGGDQSKILCHSDNPAPVVMWLIGQITTIWMYDRNGYPAPWATVNIVPLSSTARATGAAHLYGLSKDAKDGGAAASWGLEQVRMYTWMNTGAPGKGTGGAPPPPPEFAEFYDATVRLQDKANMDKLAIVDLKEHDLVMIECTVQRYALRAEQQQSARLQRRAPMDKWVAYYNLQAVYLLHAAAQSAVMPALGGRAAIDI